MSKQFRSLESLARHLRRDLNGVHARKKTAKRKGTSKVSGNDYVLLFAHNSVGKTRLSMAFKQLGRKDVNRDTLYFNAFTEDLFNWDNDLAGDSERRLRFKSESQFFSGMEGRGIDESVRAFLHRYADFNFTINYEESEISFFRSVVIAGRRERLEDIKISRGEENLFIWCFFLAILQLALEARIGDDYAWVKYVYIDDPISSLDEHNAIAVASDLGNILRAATNNVKAVISTHHGLFFNVMFNELKGKRSGVHTSKDIRKKSYVLSRPFGSGTYTLLDTGESPFLHHVEALKELHAAAKCGNVSQFHCNSLRSVLEKTSVFFGRKHFSSCFEGLPEKSRFSRFVNIRSHAKYSVFDPVPLTAEEKRLFRQALSAFCARFPFNLV